MGDIFLVSNEITKNILYFVQSGEVENLKKFLKHEAKKSGFEKSKSLIHSQLFLNLDHTELEDPTNNKRQTYPLVSDSNKLDENTYLDFIFELDLLKEFLDMMTAIGIIFPALKIPIEFLTKAVNSEKFPAIDCTFKKLFICNLTKIIVNTTSCNIDEYLALFDYFVKEMIKDENMAKSDKAILLLDICLTGCSKKEDFDEDATTEFAYLHRKWQMNFYKYSHETLLICDYIFSARGEERESIDISMDIEKGREDNQNNFNKIMDILKNILQLEENKKIIFFNSEDENVLKTVKSPITEFNSFMEYLGAVAFLSKIILDKYQPKNTELIMELITQLSVEKPKMNYYDFQYQNYEEFLYFMKMHGHYESYQTIWFNKYLEFPESLKSDEDLEIAEKYVTKYKVCDLEILRLLIAKIDNLQKEFKTNRVKQLGIHALILLPNKENKNTFIQEYYKNGTNSNFMLESFSTQVKVMCTRLRALQMSDQETVTGEFYEDIIYGLCFQHPTKAMDSFLLHSIRSGLPKILHISKVFHDLYTFSSNEDVLFVQSLLNIISKASSKSNLIDRIKSALCVYVQENLISFKKMFEILKLSIFESFESYSFDKASHLIIALNKVVEIANKVDLNKEMEKKVRNFHESLLMLTYPGTKTIGRHRISLFKIRDLLYDTLKKIRATTTTEVNLNPPIIADIVRTGLYHIRERTEYGHSHPYEATVKRKDDMRDIIIIIHSIIGNISTLESQQGYAFIEKFYNSLKNTCTDLSFAIILRKVLFSAQNFCYKENFFIHYLRFYSLFFEEQKNKMKNETPLNMSMSTNEQLHHFYNLVILAQRAEKREETSFILTILLNYTENIIAKNSSFFSCGINRENLLLLCDEIPAIKNLPIKETIKKIFQNDSSI